MTDGALPLPKIDVDPLEPNVWEQWYSWYQLHYHQLVVILCALLCILCGAMLCVSMGKKQHMQYVPVKRVWSSESEIECDGINVQPMQK